nr:glutamate-rich WD repeat-containing protein 1-like [Penaeus vannamei]
MSDNEDNDEMMMEEFEPDQDEMEEENQNVHKQEGEKYECDLSAYTLFHEGSTGAPCLSFDILRDKLGDNRDCETPVSCYFVAGTQAARTHVNNIIVMKMGNLKKISEGDEDEDDEDEEEDEDGDPVISSAMVKHNGCVNRIRSTVINNVSIAASWSELGVVHLWDLSQMLGAVDENSQQHVLEEAPIFSFRGHRTEGFAVDWAPSMPGTLATGDCDRNIHIWKPAEGASWSVDSRPYTAHQASVEDIQWSPNEPQVFASCSVDRSIRIWDCRANPSKACMISVANAHESDVNVIHWNRNEPFIVSGGDDGKVQVWDLRQIQNSSPVAVLKHHEAPVTTVEWHPSDASVLATGGEDHQILQWDLAVERDTDEQNQDEESDVPEQLLFIHRGQHEVKELHWHPQVPGLIISTAHSGFNIFKTISC